MEKVLQVQNKSVLGNFKTVSVFRVSSVQQFFYAGKRIDHLAETKKNSKACFEQKKSQRFRF